MSRRADASPGLVARGVAAARARIEDRAQPAARSGPALNGSSPAATDSPTDPPAELPADRLADDGVEGAAGSYALVQRAQAGDAEAFGELYDRYVEMVHRYVALRVGSPQLAEDLTSETFLRALRRIGTFRWQGRDVGAWFVTIARNLVADHYKSSRYRLELTTDALTPSDTPVQDGPEGEVIAALQSEQLLEAVRRLGPEQQECIALRFLQGLSVAETAAVMGRGDGAVKALQYRAVKSLGRLLPDGLVP